MPIECRQYSWWGLLTTIVPVEPNPDVFYLLSESWPIDTPGLSVRRSVSFPTDNSAVIALSWGMKQITLRPRVASAINTVAVDLRREPSSRLAQLLGDRGVAFAWVPDEVKYSRKFSLRRR